MPERRALILFVMSFSLSLLVTTGAIEATTKDSPVGEGQCDPSEVNSCSEVQSSSNELNSSARQTSESDQTRPSDSIEAEEQDEVQTELGDKNVPGPSQVQEGMYSVKIKLEKIKIILDHEDNHGYQAQPLEPGTDAEYNGGEFEIYAYIQGKRSGISWPGSYLHTLPGRTITLSEADRTLEVRIPPGGTLSIMVGGYEKDACPEYRYPKDISYYVIRANGNKEYLETLQKSLNDNINVGCAPTDEKHDTLGYINSVYKAPTFGSSSSPYVVGSVRVPNAPDYELTYQITAAPILNADVQK